MSRWFRFYDDAIDDPKVQALPGDLFKTWVNLLCVASKHGGKLPAADLPFLLRMDERRANAALADLTKRGLIDSGDDGPEPHNWDGRQHKSDVSNDRVQRHRERARTVTGNVTSTVTVTPPDTETDTEQIESSEPKGSGGEPPSSVVPIDERTALFREGLSTLKRITGKPDAASRQLVGKWLKVVLDDPAVVLSLIRRADETRVIDPVSWIERALKPPDPDAAIYRGVDFQ